MRAVRFVFRLLSALALALAVILAVGDAARTIAASALQVTPLMTSWLRTAPAGAEAAESWVKTHLGAPAWDWAFVPVLGLPGFLVFGVVALLFYALGRKPKPRPGRIAGTA
ncbi:hypothetical protein ACFOEZ_15710 [Tianweitania populi]|uniref:Uncharacterized protein n=1 Tax=Tianweitania populi TaxID=1607949 RepID=A0A8J3DS48_9HYPH|nr:hypothetical protein [Tianweitania populi]GHD15914.1 hypothetical protein GCM10016234_23410 [Tianweitania populi]